MRKILRQALASLLVCFGLSAPVALATTDYADFWWVSSESGWGVNISQQGDVLFATIFTYDANNHSLWLSVAAFRTAGTETFSGDLYRNTGPFYGTGFDPNAVVREKVGTATLNFSNPSSAALTYNVGGVTVTKSLSRITYAPIAFDGSYFYDAMLTGTNCLALNIPELPDTVPDLNIAVAGGNVQVSFAGCSLSGAYTQAGSVVSASGTTSACFGYSAGTWQLRDGRMLDGVITFYGRIDFTAPLSCYIEGRFTGIKAN